jgi:hypothetical protein
MKRHRSLANALIVGLLMVLVAGPASLQAGATGPQPLTANFNGDRYADLAIGVPYETLEGPPTVSEAGAVSVLYGSAPDGLSGVDDQFWSQNSTGTQDAAGDHEHFGQALAAGDFDGDGYVDLAVGVPQQGFDGAANAGAVHVLYGTANGLAAADDEVWYEGYAGLGGAPETGDWFGRALAAGDFDGNGCDDLAVGIPSEDLGGVNDAGRVVVLYGTADGLSAEDSDAWVQGLYDIPDTYELGDYFGERLATGDWNGDGYADLAVGVPRENFEDEPPTRYDVGVVHILYGSGHGLTATGTQLWYQDRGDIEDSSQQYDAFGWALASGDFDGDGWDDLAVGVPGQPAGSADYAGGVHLLYGSPGGLTANRDRLLTEAELGVTAKYDDGFGDALASADFDGDGYADLAVGIPSRDLLGVSPEDVGSVNVLYGSSGGLSTEDIDTWYQWDLLGLEDEPEEGDQFGEVLAAADFNGDGYADLAVGIPHEDIEYVPTPAEDAGAVQVLYGTAEGLDAEGNQFWHQGAPVRDVGEEGDRFGYALASIPTLRLPTVYLPVVLRNYRP